MIFAVLSAVTNLVLLSSTEKRQLSRAAMSFIKRIGETSSEVERSIWNEDGEDNSH